MDRDFKQITDEIKDTGNISEEQLKLILVSEDTEDEEYLFDAARKTAEEHFGKAVYLRGLVEFTNYCVNDCYYCGIRCSNTKAERYRLSEDEILSCCDIGESIGFKTFVLHGGEDPYFTDDRICSIVKKIKERHPSCAVTLSIGERSYESYKRFFDAGADRYLLRHETADKTHYNTLHPSEMSFENRLQCLENLKKIGFQTGCGMMIGSPFQSAEDLAEDMLFISQFKPHMVGMGPFIPHKDTPFAGEKAGSVELTLFLISLLRIMLPKANIPATTALGTLDPFGREKGVEAGANVVMPNLSPTAVRKKYALYDNKICTGDESAQCVTCLNSRLKNIGYEIEISRGDYKA